MNKSQTNNIPIKWLKFLVNWLIPIGIILNVISFNSLISYLPQNSLFSVLFEIFYVLIAIVFPLIVLGYCIQYKKQGYYLLKIFLVAEVVFNCAFACLNNVPLYVENPLADFLATFIPLVFIFSVLWIYPNFIYLKDRKVLFSGENKVNNSNQNINFSTEKNKNSAKTKNKNQENITFSINKKRLITIISLFISTILIIIGIYYLNNYINSLKEDIKSLTIKYNELENTYNKSKETLAEKVKRIKNEEKLEFFDENIVFVLEGYGNYYYTYDQVQQITNGKSFSYWAYNKEAAISEGYQAFPE